MVWTCTRSSTSSITVAPHLGALLGKHRIRRYWPPAFSHSRNVPVYFFGRSVSPFDRSRFSSTSLRKRPLFRVAFPCEAMSSVKKKSSFKRQQRLHSESLVRRLSAFLSCGSCSLRHLHILVVRTPSGEETQRGRETRVKYMYVRIMFTHVSTRESGQLYPTLPRTPSGSSPRRTVENKGWEQR